MSACFPCSALPGYIHSFYRWILSCFYELPFLFIRLGFCSFMLVWLCVRTFWEPMGAISVLGTLIPSLLTCLCYVSVPTFNFILVSFLILEWLLLCDWRGSYDFYTSGLMCLQVALSSLLCHGYGPCQSHMGDQRSTKLRSEAGNGHFHICIVKWYGPFWIYMPFRKESVFSSSGLWCKVLRCFCKTDISAKDYTLALH